MLNQIQSVEAVKSSIQSKNLKNSLIGNFIKSKLHLLMLLTVTTGGIFIGNMMVPALIPPAQAGIISLAIQKMSKISPKISMYAGDVLELYCKGGGYNTSAAAAHTVTISKKLGDEWRVVKKFSVPYGNSREFPLESGYYKYKINTIEGDVKEGVIEVQ